MQYMTMIRELIQERKQLHEQLRRSRLLLATVDLFARELKASHDTCKEVLRRANPAADPTQIAGEALKIALKDLEERLPSESMPDDSETLSLDEAMAYIRAYTPLA